MSRKHILKPGEKFIANNPEHHTLNCPCKYCRSYDRHKAIMDREKDTK